MKDVDIIRESENILDKSEPLASTDLTPGNYNFFILKYFAAFNCQHL